MMTGILVLLIILAISAIVSIILGAYTLYLVLSITSPKIAIWKYDEEDPIDGYVDYCTDNELFYTDINSSDDEDDEDEDE